MDARLQRLKEIQSELHDVANTFAGPTTGTIAGTLHQAGIEVGHAIRMLETGISKEDREKLADRFLINQLSKLDLH
jgi:hypothetical protein